jgi:DNA adenine methylase
MAPLIRQVLEGQFIEPFLGSGAMFFAVAPTTAVLGDLNAELINVYRQVARHGSAIEAALKRMKVDSDTYYRTRAAKPAAPVEQATRFIYLNRTCFGGLHRTNQKGDFNVPYGGGSRTPEPVYRDHLLEAAGRVLRRKKIKLIAGDFEALIDTAEAGDVVFCDPTYRSAGRGRFDRYGPVIFSWADQTRLLRASLRARDRGAIVIVMNVDDPEVAALYGEAIIVRAAKTKSIGNRAKRDNSHRELIAVLDPKHRGTHWAALRQTEGLMALQGAA